MTSRWSGRRARFRSHLAAGQCMFPASVHDPVSARIADGLGFEIGMLAGSVASLAVLGAPDLITLTLTEFAEQAHRIGRACELPLMVDADHGYGNALSVMRTVEELEAAGVSGLSIEDTLLPRRFGSGAAPELLSREEGLGKVKAALAARRDPSLAIAGRTSAPMIAGLEETLARARLYAEAGADAIFLVGIRDRDLLERVAAEIKLPLIIGGVAPDLLDAGYLAGQGVRICIAGHQPFEAAVAAIHATMKALREGTAPKDIKGLASKELMRQVTRVDDYERWSKAWLGTAE